MQGKKVVQTRKNYPGTPRVDFLTPDFDALVDNKGYDVIWERALPCPCAGRQGTNLTVCKNCSASGWVFINPTKIKMVGQSINKATKFKDWSAELLGTISITVRSEHRLGFMDKLTLLNAEAPTSEVQVVRDRNGLLFVPLIYPINSVREVFLFVDPKEPLRLLPKESYTIDRHFLYLSETEVKPKDFVTVSYMHPVQYGVFDLNHDIRNTIILDNESKEQDLPLPIAAIARRFDLLIGKENIVADNTFDNSYLP